CARETVDDYSSWSVDYW
nr:immunoglobulin heavy chain junction region [Macaca mulatta]MOW76109.1 immunoglobulin heavy chain junction region [Macaca mulatta]MOW76837.1 immunoglobulin heavy chain junction region [Macaca mulatta]MOW77715.1 immunoglobulin heavy chain junction region [Macaca mulatta]MOW77768.1 immunoglobulin heavy chain junction region [Macaca mulatta]